MAYRSTIPINAVCFVTPWLHQRRDYVAVPVHRRQASMCTFQERAVLVSQLAVSDHRQGKHNVNEAEVVMIFLFSSLNVDNQSPYNVTHKYTSSFSVPSLRPLPPHTSYFPLVHRPATRLSVSCSSCT